MDLEPNLSQMLHLFQLIPKLVIFIHKQLKRPAVFGAMQLTVRANVWDGSEMGPAPSRRGPETTRTMNCAWPDHSCVAVMWHCEITTTQSKISGAAIGFQFSKPSTIIPQLAWHVVMGEDAAPQIGNETEHPHEGLIHPGFIRGSNALQCHGTSDGCVFQTVAHDWSTLCSGLHNTSCHHRLLILN